MRAYPRRSTTILTDGDGLMTERIFLDDPAAASVSATVLAAGPDGIVLDRTVFYARGGGQPGDTGTLRWDGGDTIVIDTVKGDDGEVVHQPEPDATLPLIGTRAEATIDWQRRHALMRMHTAMHLLCSLIEGAAVTGGSVGVEKSRLDFDLPVPPKKEDIETRLNALIVADHPVRIEWVDESVLDTDPGLVRTMSVKPPRGTGRLRLIRIGDGNEPLDLQPCGGTHVARTGEIGPLKVLKIENKGKQNRRIVIVPG
jgi:misacylated tRNA(Ala) deacylase